MKEKKEQGNVVIEASIVMTIAVVMVAVLINLGLMLYQRSLMEAVALDAATNVANVYSSTYREPIYGYIDENEFYENHLYRYLSNAFFSTQDDASIRKAEWYSLYRLKKGELISYDDLSVQVDVIQKPGTLIQHQVVVSITADFEMPLTAIWGGNNKAQYTAIGKADCIDLLDYFNTVGTVQDTVMSKLDKFFEKINKIVSIFDLESLEG